MLRGQLNNIKTKTKKTITPTSFFFFRNDVFRNEYYSLSTSLQNTVFIFALNLSQLNWIWNAAFKIRYTLLSVTTLNKSIFFFYCYESEALILKTYSFHEMLYQCVCVCTSYSVLSNNSLDYKNN